MDEGQTLRSMVRDDAYRVVRVLADGPGGRTELVMLDGEGPLVRKRMPLTLANAPAWAEAMNIDEPLLPRIESLYRTPHELVVVYEYVEGVRLTDLVDAHGPLASEVAVHLLADVCQAVSALHAHGVIHRDITPNNVIVDAQGRAHLVDLGIARQRRANGQRDTTTLGTWGFAAPEQYGFAQTDARSDVYALGRLLAYLLSGVMPDERSSEEPVLQDERLAEVVRKATAFEPSARYQSVDELMQALTADSRGAQRKAKAPEDNERVVQKVEPASAERAVRPPREGMRGVPQPEPPREVRGQGQSAPTGAAPTPEASPLPAEEVRTQASPSPGGWLRAWLAARLAWDEGFSRHLYEAPFSTLLPAGIVWVACLLLTLLIVMVGFDAVTKHDPPWGAVDFGIAVILIGGMAVLCIEIYAMVARRGPYARKARRTAFLIYNIAIIVLVIFTLLLVFINVMLRLT